MNMDRSYYAPRSLKVQPFNSLGKIGVYWRALSRRITYVFVMHMLLPKNMFAYIIAI